MNRFTFISTTSLFLCSALSFCQENLRPGFIVRLNGDTSHVWIDSKNWDRNPSEITFKESENIIPKTASPLTIKAFSVDGESYISSDVQVETSPYLLNELTVDAKLHFEYEKAFLYRLAEGKKSLYHYKDVRGKDHFYIPTDSGMTLLTHKFYIKIIRKEDAERGNYSDGKSLYMDNEYHYKTENKSYMGQLASYLGDCQSVIPMINAVEYKQSDILKLFKIYQKNCDQDLKVNLARSGSNNFGVLTGVSLNSLEWGKNSTFTFSSTKYNYQPNIVFGLFLDWKFRGNRWSLNNELLYAPFHVQGSFENIISPERYVKSESEIGSRYFKANNMIRFHYPLGKITAYVNGGISNSYGSLTQNFVATISKNYGDVHSDYGMAMVRTDKYELGFNFGLGLEYRLWLFQARWEVGDGMSSLAALKSKTKRYYFLLGYRFNSKGQN